MTDPVLFTTRLSLLLLETSPDVTLVDTCHVKLVIGVRGGDGGPVSAATVLVCVELVAGVDGLGVVLFWITLPELFNTRLSLF